MPRVMHRDFSKGLFVAGERDIVPPGYLRRAKNIARCYQPHVRSRFGSALVATLPGNPIMMARFGDLRYVQIGTGFYRVTSGVVSTVFGPGGFAGWTSSGRRLNTMTAVPTVDTRRDTTTFPFGPDHLFVVGGNVTTQGFKTGGASPFKMSVTGEISAIGLPEIAESSWSIGKSTGQFGIEIDTFDTTSTWQSDTTLATVSNNKQQGSAAVQMTIPAESTRGMYRQAALNLATFFNPGLTVSSLSDWIQLWVFCDNPKNLDSLELIFDTTDGSLAPSDVASTRGLEETYSFKVFVDDAFIDETLGAPTGTGDSPDTSDLANVPKRNKVYGRGGVFIVDRDDDDDNLGKDIPGNTAKLIVNDLGSTKLANTGTTWTLLRIPKSSFIRAGASNFDSRWAYVRRLIIKATSNKNGIVNLYFDDWKVHLGVGTMGEYQHALTYWNDRTGERSNPSDIKTTKNVKRDFFSLTMTLNALTAGRVRGATHIEIWRSIGNGNTLYLSRRVEIGQPIADRTFVDLTSDFPAVQAEPSIFGFAGNNGEFGLYGAGLRYLSEEELPFDNVQPPDTVVDVVGPHLGRAFYLDGLVGQRNKVLWTPPGRLCSIESFALVGHDDDPLHRLILWNGEVFVWSEEKVWRAEGQGPFLFVEVFGVPGTSYPWSIVPTPHGIVYRAKDGIRVFNGSNAQLIAPDPVLRLFRGDGTAGFINAFSGSNANIPAQLVTATYKDDEYVIADVAAGVTLGVDLRTGAWRQVSTAIGPICALYTEPDTNVLLVGTHSSGQKLLDWEKPGTTSDDGTAIAFEIETPGVIAEDQSGNTKLVQRVYFDTDPASQTLTPTLRYYGNDGSVSSALTDITGATRGITEEACLVASQIVGIRITGTVSAQVTIHGVGFDWHQPEEGGTLV